MPQFFVDLKDLARDKVSLDGTFEPGAIDLEAEGMRQVGPLVLNASAERAGDEIRIAGGLRVDVETACSRCLEPAACHIAREFDLFFRQRDEGMFDEDAEIELTEEDTQTAFFTGTELAIGDVLREQILLGLPMKTLCRVDCKGLCPNCGTNLNLNTCGCPPEQPSLPLHRLLEMDKLLEIKRKLEERSS